MVHPLWVRQLNYLFHSAASTVDFFFICLTIILLAKTKWRFHLRWLIPFAIGDGIGILLLLIGNFHLLWGVRYTYNLYSLTYLLADINSFAIAYGVIVLYLTMKKTVLTVYQQSPESNDVDQKSDVWPPPPDFRQ